MMITENKVVESELKHTCLIIADCASLATSGLVSPFNASDDVPSLESASIFYVDVTLVITTISLRRNA